MSEHSKGPELRYDAEKGEIRRGRELMADVYLPCGPYGPALAEREALGRKMAAAPELVEALRWSQAMLRTLMHDVEPKARDSFAAGLRANESALAKAGVKP